MPFTIMSASNTADRKQYKKRALKNIANETSELKKSMGLSDSPGWQTLADMFKRQDSKLERALKVMKQEYSGRKGKNAVRNYDVRKIAKITGVTPQIERKSHFKNDVNRVASAANCSKRVAQLLIALDDWESSADDIIPYVKTRHPGFLESYPHIAQALDQTDGTYAPLYQTNFRLNKPRDNLVELRKDELNMMWNSKNITYNEALLQMMEPDAVNIDAVCTNLRPDLYSERLPTNEAQATYPYQLTQTTYFTSGILGSSAVISVLPYDLFCPAGTAPSTGLFIANINGTNSSVTSNANGFGTPFGQCRVIACLTHLESAASTNTNSGDTEMLSITDASKNSSATSPQVTTAGIQSNPYYSCISSKLIASLRSKPDASFNTVNLAAASPYYGYAHFFTLTGLAASTTIRVTTSIVMECSAGATAYSPFKFKTAEPGYFTSQFLSDLYTHFPQISFFSDEHAAGLISALRSVPPKSRCLMKAVLDYTGGVNHLYDAMKSRGKMNSVYADSDCSEISFDKC